MLQRLDTVITVRSLSLTAHQLFSGRPYTATLDEALGLLGALFTCFYFPTRGFVSRSWSYTVCSVFLVLLPAEHFRKEL